MPTHTPEESLPVEAESTMFYLPAQLVCELRLPSWYTLQNHCVYYNNCVITRPLQQLCEGRTKLLRQFREIVHDGVGL